MAGWKKYLFLFLNKILLTFAWGTRFISRKEIMFTVSTLRTKKNVWVLTWKLPLGLSLWNIRPGYAWLHNSGFLKGRCLSFQTTEPFDAFKVHLVKAIWNGNSSSRQGQNDWNFPHQPVFHGTVHLLITSHRVATAKALVQWTPSTGWLELWGKLPKDWKVPAKSTFPVFGLM